MNLGVIVKMRTIRRVRRKYYEGYVAMRNVLLQYARTLKLAAALITNGPSGSPGPGRPPLDFSASVACPDRGSLLHD